MFSADFINDSTCVYLLSAKNKVQTLRNSEILNYSICFEEFLRKFLEGGQCLGLLMDHNLYIPSIILSVEKIGIPFIFLQYFNDFSKTIKDLSIKWVLSFDNNLLNFTKKAEFFIKENYLLYLYFTPEEQKRKFSRKVFCIVKTSGSTGDNKYVEVEHHCIKLNAKSLSKIWNVTPNDTIYYGTPLTFDPSLIEILIAIITGASLIIVPKNVQINPYLLYETLFNNRIRPTILQIVPSVFLRWSETQIKFIINRSSLRVIAFGGEPFPIDIIKHRISNIKIYNLYGITEISCWASICEVQNNDVHLGVALDETVIELRDETSGDRITEGQGKIFIGSSTRICHIIGQRDCNFRDTGDLGEIRNKKIYYLGRRNSIIKRFGFRINLKKIEFKIETDLGLKNRVIWYKDKLLIFFVMDKEIDKERVLDKIRIKLLHLLPKEAMPDFLEVVPKFPLSCHGKINDKSLIEIYCNTEKIVKDPKEVFNILINKYLGLEVNKYVNYNFMELGGNSILAVQLLQEFKHNLGVEYPEDLVLNLFQNSIKHCFDCINKLNPIAKLNFIEVQNSKVLENKVSFQIKWKYNFKACVDSTPFCFTSSKGTNLVASGSFSQIFSVLKAENGKEICKVILPGPIESKPTISMCGHYLYVGCFDGNLYCINYEFNEITWIYETGDRIRNTPQDTGSCLVFGSYDKFVHCIDYLGILKWKRQLKGCICANLISFNNKIYCATITGDCYCLSNLGIVIWHENINKPIFGSGCILKNLIIWPDVTGTLHALDLELGKEIWCFSVNNFIYSSLIKKNDFIVFGCHDKNLYIINCSTIPPKITYLIPFNGAISSTPCLDDKGEIILAASNCGDLKVIDFKNGNIIGFLSLPSDTFSSPCFNNVNKDIFIGCRDNFLYCINILNMET